MSNCISRRAFLKGAGASVVALGASGMLAGCKQNGSSTVVSVKVGDKVSNWNGLGVQLSSLFGVDTAPQQEGYEYLAVLVTVVNRTKDQTFTIGAQNVDANFHALAADTTDFVASCDGQTVECTATISLYNQNSQTFSESVSLPPQGTGYVQLMLMVPQGWKELHITYMPTFVADKTITFNMTSADVTRA